MAKNKPTKQHFVPKNYLEGFIDPNNQKCVWVFKKGSRKGTMLPPSNILKKTDLYTLKLNTGKKDYSIEETLSDLEGKFATIFHTKIKHHIPLGEEDHIYLCAFVGTMLQRMLKHRDNLNDFIDQLIGHAESAELQYGVDPEESNRLKEYKKNFFQRSVVVALPDITKLLLNMGLAFLCAKGSARFVTSDDPCNLFNADLQWQKFYGPGLKQKNVQVTLPLSPDIMLCMSWTNFRGYINYNNRQVNEANRMIVGHCYKEYISNSPHAKRMWLRRYPIDPFFILKILKYKRKIFFYKLKMWWKYRRYVGK